MLISPAHRPLNLVNFIRLLALPIVVVCACAFATISNTNAAEVLTFAEVIEPAIRKHCAKCHGQNEDVQGDINLLKLDSRSNLVADAETVRKLIDVLELEEMPPEDEPALPDDVRERLIVELRKILHESVTTNKSYATAPLRRMNRFQYNNAVQDLFDLKRVVFTLPERMLRDHSNYFQPDRGKMPDKIRVGSRPLGKSQLIEPRLAGVAPYPQDLRAEHGFDNRGDHLSLSPLLYESFLRLSRSIVESPDFGPKTCGIWQDFFAPPTSSVEDAVRQRLREFLTKAFRRPVTDEVLARYAGHVTTQIKSGETFENAMKAAASAAIASPRFLYLYDRGAGDSAPEKLDDYELASRLSFFLWGSIPDEELLDIAATGKLSDPEELSKQVDRMLNDRRLKRFSDSFPAQWLQLERIISSVPDRAQFPDFYFSKYRSSMHMMLEPLLVFEAILIEDRSIMELVDSDFSYRSGRLETLYYGNRKAGPGNPVTAIPFERVSVKDRRFGGIVTNAAIMTMTSGPERTKPITRGAWLATVVFNDPPPPPPADVPPLPEEPPEDEADLTLRERLAAHRERIDCAGCHEKIDPLGFALENYGPTGKWRDQYESGRDIDVAGVLFRKHPFNDIVEFKDAILAEKHRFARAFATHLLSFSLAREATAADSLAIEEIVGNVANTDYRMRSLIKEVVLSEPFRYKTNPIAAVTDE